MIAGTNSPFMKIFCVGRNYVAHALELKNEVPTDPLIFMKPSTALLLEDKPFFHPEFSKNIHYEVELVMRICKNGKHIKPEFAYRYYDAMALGIDFTARDLQDTLKAKGQPWELAKGFDNSAVVSKFIELNDLGEAPYHFSLQKNGTLVQSGNTENMIFTFDKIICFISQFITLQKGDYIFTGTPAGVGKIETNDVYQGFIDGRQMFTCAIK